MEVCARAKRTALARAPISPWQDVLCFRGEEDPVKTAPFFGAPKGSLDGVLLPADNRKSGEWERTASEPRRFGILWAVSPHRSRSAWHLRLPLAPLLFALGRAHGPAARWGPSFWWGAAISVATSMDQDTERSLPRSDGYALLRCQSVPPSPVPRFPRSADSVEPVGYSPPLRRHGFPTLPYLLTIPQRLICLPGHP